MLNNPRNPDRVNPPFDAEASLKEAYARMPIERVMEQFGHAPANGQWKSFTCPFCQKQKKSAGTFDPKMGGPRMFKCQSTSCPTGAQAMPPVSYIMQVTGEDRKQAFVNYLKMAGVWKERTKMGTAGNTRVHDVPLDEPDPDGGENWESAGEKDPNAKPQIPIKSQGPNANGGWGSEISAAAGLAGSEEPNRATPGGAEEAGERANTRSSAELSGNGEHRTSNIEHRTLNGDGDGYGEKLETPYVVSYNPEDDVWQAVERALTGRVTRFIGPGRQLMWPVADAADAMMRKLPAFEAQLRSEAAPPKPVNDGWRSLRAFYSVLSLSLADEKILFYRRGLESRTSAALGFRSNPKSNRDALVNLAVTYPFEELRAAGIWQPKDAKRKKERRPNSQFCGAGKIRKLKAGERPGRGEWTDDEGNLWGWCEPVLIPYFDAAGELICLRPHKGFGPSGTLAGTPMPYVPRLGKAARTGKATEEERFELVVITEGEFKAVAIWQTLGAGRTDGGEPCGVTSLPGINYAKHYEAREVLDDWLRVVKCRRVVVAFDNEEKGDPALASYKEDWRKRYDAQIWARYLATDLATKLHIRGEVCILPGAWRNEKGKADWDGKLAQATKGVAWSEREEAVAGAGQPQMNFEP